MSLPNGIPSAEDVREAYSESVHSSYAGKAYAEFDAWLADHDRRHRAETSTSTWDTPLPCPECGHYTVFGYLFRNELGEHMHTHYVCALWRSGSGSPCGWHGWSVPGWDAEGPDGGR